MSSIPIVGNAIKAGSYIAIFGITLEENHAAHYTYDSFTKDGTWHDLDLSAHLPAGTTMFWARAIVKAGTTSANLYLRKNGNTAMSDVHAISTQAANVNHQADVGPVGIDANRVVEYQCSANPGASWTDIQLVIQSYA